ncbi:hypothetical protein GQ457_10G010060 [Hibiscus cannabinus]
MRENTRKGSRSHQRILLNIPILCAYQKESERIVKVKDLKPKRIKGYLEYKFSQRTARTLHATLPNTHIPSITDKLDASSAVNSSQGTNPMKTVDAASPTIFVSILSDFTHPEAIVSVKESEGSKTIGTVVGLVLVESGDPVNLI